MFRTIDEYDAHNELMSQYSADNERILLKEELEELESELQGAIDPLEIRRLKDAIKNLKKQIYAD